MADSEHTPRLRPAHVLASSLAAVTGAFLASRLGVYGTVIGVGVISLFSTIGTDVYVRSLDRTRHMAARSRTIALSRTGPAVETAELPRTANAGELSEVAATKQEPRVSGPAGPSPTDALEAADQSTQPAYSNPADRGRETTTDMATGRPVADSDAQVTKPAADSNPGRWTKARIFFVAAGAVASFALAFVLITGIESVFGSSLSGGGRTTVGELIVDGGNSSDPDDTDSEDVDAPEQPVPTPEPTTSSPAVTDPPDGDDRDVPPPAEEAPDAEPPSDPETPSPSPTESPTSEPTEPPADGGENSSMSSTDSQTAS
jgi:hypothetical protein